MRRLAGTAVAVLSDERFDDLGDLLLLTPWQFRGGFKHQLQAAFGRMLLGLALNREFTWLIAVIILAPWRVLEWLLE